MRKAECSCMNGSVACEVDETAHTITILNKLGAVDYASSVGETISPKALEDCRKGARERYEKFMKKHQIGNPNN